MNYITFIRSTLNSVKDQYSFLEKFATILNDLRSAPLRCLQYAFVPIVIERFVAMCCYQMVRFITKFFNCFIHFLQKRVYLNKMNKIWTWNCIDFLGSNFLRRYNHCVIANDLLSNSSGKYRCFDPKMRLSTILVLLSAISFSLVFSITSEIKKSKMESIGLIPNNISKFQKNNQRTINNKAFLLPRKILPNFAMETLIKLIYTEMDQLLRGVDKIDIIEECKKDMKLSLQTINDFVKNDREMSNWQKSYLQNALLPMIDASAKIPPSGILRGHVTVFGQYKECMLVKQQLPNSTRVITGSYVRIFVDKKLRSYNTKGACELTEYSIGNPSFDVCLPSSCDQYQTLITLSRSLIQSDGSTPVCTVKQASVRFRPIDYKTWIVLSIIALIGAVAMVATAWDLFKIYFDSHYYKLSSYESAQWFRCLVAFSMIRNTKDVFNIENANKSGQIGPIHFMRFISMIWVIFGHATASYMIFSSNILDCKETFKNLWTQFLTNAFFSVDTFFFISGLLVSYIWFKEYRKDKRKTMSPTAWVIFYIHRIIRLSPPYYFVIAFYSFVFKSFLINMPLILITVDDYCEKSWWTNFLYLNNFIHYNDQCYLVSWYLATDFQLHIFSPTLLIPLALKPVLGYIVAGLLILLSTIANLVTMYKGYFPPTDFFIGAMDPRMGSYEYYSLLIYQAPWIRCQVYIIGILVGYLFQTKKTLHIPKLMNIICWIISVILGLLLIMSLRDWIGYDIVMDLSMRAFYSAFSKLAWSLMLAYITIACFYGYGGPINDFMSLSIWKPLGRLTYCTYLIHLIVMLYILCIGVNAFSFSSITHTFFVFTLPCCILSWFFAYWLSILFELPASKLEMILLDKFIDTSPQNSIPLEIHAVEQNYPEKFGE
ncbi:Nose resistant to fluoxetine protein [Dirofilaria immitis]